METFVSTLFVLKLNSHAHLHAFSSHFSIVFQNVFEFDDNMKLQNHFFLGDQEEIKRKMESVANQGKAK